MSCVLTRRRLFALSWRPRQERVRVVPSILANRRQRSRGEHRLTLTLSSRGREERANIPPGANWVFSNGRFMDRSSVSHGVEDDVDGHGVGHLLGELPEVPRVLALALPPVAQVRVV